MRKVWFITGASRGIGAEIVSAALEAGDRVVATARNAGPLARALPADRFIALPLDVTDRAQAATAVAKTVAQFGGIDVLVNNAGYGQLGIFEENTPEDADQQFATNVFGVFNVTRAVLPVMREKRSGHLINLSSIAGFRGAPGGSLYCASKFAVEGFSEALSKELASFNIRVTIVEPGFIRTDFLDASSLRYGKVEIADYAELSRRLKTAYGAHNHLQSGNPAKLAKTMIEISRHPNPPLRLPMGSDAVSAVAAKLDSARAELETWRETSCSSDGFED